MPEININKMIIIAIVTIAAIIAVPIVINNMKGRTQSKKLGKIFGGKTTVSLSPSERQTIVETIRGATEGWGTNENNLFNALRLIPNKSELLEIERIYSSAYNESIIDTLKSELDKSELDEALLILQKLR